MLCPRTLGIWALAALLTGCKGGVLGGESCERELDGLQSTLDQTRVARDLDRRAAIVDLVDGEGERHTPELVLRVFMDKIYRELDTDGTELAQLRAELQREQPRSIGLAIDEGTRWSTVVELVHAIGEDTEAELFVLVRGPEDPQLATAAARFGADGGIGALAEAFEANVKRCRPMTRLLGTIADEGPMIGDDEPGQRLLRSTPEALRECNCAADLDELGTLMQLGFGPAQEVRARRIDARAAAPKLIRKPGFASWGEVADEVLAAAAQVELQVERELDPELAPCIPPPPLNDEELARNTELERRLLASAPDRP